MTDDDLEAALRRYRVVGPAAELRDRVIDNATPLRFSARQWSAIAASMLLAAMFYWLAGIERARVTAMLGPERDVPSALEEPLR